MRKYQFNLYFKSDNSLEERHNLWGKLLRCSEALRVQHDLRNELSIGRRHSQAAEQFLQIIREIGASCVTRVHGDENGHVASNLHLFAHQFNGDGCG